MQWLWNILGDAFNNAQAWLFETVVQPLVYAVGLGGFLEDAFTATEWLLVGLIEVAVLLLIIGPLQRWKPVEPVTDKSAIRTDIIYTLVHRLGLFRVALFFLIEPFFDDGFGLLRVAGMETFHLDQIWSGVTDVPWVSFLIYLAFFDFLDYWIHRGQHHFNWWWNLHSLHHSQRQMTMWSDNRNHLLDDLIHDSIIVIVAQIVGIGPGQFVAIVAVAQLSENFQHANLRVWFGAIGERLLISPRFHRRHHTIGIGHEDNSAEVDAGKKPRLGGNNFGVLFPWWDVIFRTSDFQVRYDPTGIRDQVEESRDYGRGFWQQQWFGLKRLFGNR